MTQPLTIGRIVHFKLDEGPSRGQVRPAMVTRVWSDTCCQLNVFPDKANDGDAKDFVSSAQLADNDELAHGRWFWPPRA